MKSVVLAFTLFAALSMAFNYEDALEVACLDYAEQQINLLELEIDEILNTKPFCTKETRFSPGRRLISKTRRRILEKQRAAKEERLRNIKRDISQLRATHGALAGTAAATGTAGAATAFFTFGLSLIPMGAACTTASMEAAKLMGEINEMEKQVKDLRAEIAKIDEELCS